MSSAGEANPARALVDALSEDERVILRGILAGESQAAIASRLELERAEALALRQLLLRKLGASSTADAVRIAIYAGL